LPLADEPRKIIGMNYRAPTPAQHFLHRSAGKFEERLIDEVNGAVRPGTPRVRRNRIDDKTEPSFAAEQGSVEIAETPGGVIEDLAKMSEFIVPGERDLVVKLAAG
jgi:hypothetical protein